MLARSGKLAPALEALHEALEIARHLGSTSMVVIFTNSIGNIFTIMRRYDEAEAHFMESLSTAETTGNAKMMAAALIGLGAMKLGAGDLNEAGRCFSRANKMSHRAGNIIGQSNALSGAAQVHLLRGEPHKALPLVREAEVLAEAGGDPQAAVDIRFLHARILLARGMRDETQEVYLDACKGVAEHGITVGGMKDRTNLEEEMTRLGMAIQIEKSADR